MPPPPAGEPCRTTDSVPLAAPVNDPEMVTDTPPLPSGPCWLTVPAKVSVNGAEKPLLEAAVDGVAGWTGPALVPPRSLAGVPAVLAHPGRNGPVRVQPLRARTTAAEATPAHSRGLVFTMLQSVARRQARAADHCHRADDVDEEDPAELGVGPGPQTVGQGDRPGRVGGPVDDPPSPQADPLPDEARHDQGDHQIERQGPEAEPEGTVGADERHEHVGDTDRRKGVQHGGDDVHGEERHRHQRGVLVQARRSRSGEGRDERSGPPG